MSHPLLRELDHYVVLEPGCPEVILTAAETLQWLERRLASLDAPPADLRDMGDGASQARRLVARNPPRLAGAAGSAAAASRRCHLPGEPAHQAGAASAAGQQQHTAGGRQALAVIC